jgi:uridine kinase
MNGALRGDHLPNAERLARSLAELVSQRLAAAHRARGDSGGGRVQGSGKSMTATGLARELTTTGIATELIHQDDWFFRPPRTNHEYRLL